MKPERLRVSDDFFALNVLGAVQMNNVTFWIYSYLTVESNLDVNTLTWKLSVHILFQVQQAYAAAYKTNLCRL